MSGQRTTISMLVAAQAAVAARQVVVHDRLGVDPDDRMWASRLCSRQLDAMETAILLEPPADEADLRLIALAAIGKLQTLEGRLDEGDGKTLLPIVEQLTVALEHIAAHPLLDVVADRQEPGDLTICRQHVAGRAMSQDLLADRSAANGPRLKREGK